ncbi:transglycosylase SLT domain-containing protein [Bartonella schoenbuchensis]|uniref:Lytic transglycolase n=1 Tax=Bartonella schoenbuchensis (strain DSM 13525 / NCTC 13165 / R1) TaxID=687861 RepID=E6YZ11_BARSR|nr:transglycosylase SLT domain-containing protein [Bartonella schoenbuchensis]AQX30203.1 Transglycosylase SLT domain-containing protein [Bartonella schoenbuchensis R1]CBI81751.1 Lytic transglycolase [Bartonella schoenbuchensis R1]
MINFHPHVHSAILQAAQRYDLPESFLKRVAMIESGGDPNARNKKSSAGGLYQFLDSTARQYKLDNKFDPLQSIDAMARLTKDNIRYLQTALGRAPSEAELYLAHQQGPAGAARLIKNPDAPASQLLSSQAIALNGGRPGATAGDFMNHVYQQYNRTAQPEQGYRQAVPNEAVPPRGMQRLQNVMQGDQLVAQNAPLQEQGGHGDFLKKGMADLTQLIKENAQNYDQQIQMAQNQMMQQPVFSQGGARPADLTPLISPRRQPSSFNGRQRGDQLRKEFLTRAGVYNV